VDALKERLWTFAEQSASYAIFLIHEDHRVAWANPAARNIFGTETGDVVGRTLEQFFVPEDIAIGIPQHEFVVALSHGTAENDRWMRRADGSRFWASGMMAVLTDAGGEVIGFAKILRDRTEVKMEFETLRNRAEATAAAVCDKDRAIAVVAHEFRNPLSSVKLAAMALRKLSDAPRAHNALDIVDRNVDFAARMLDDLMDATRMTAGKVDLETEPLALHDVLAAAIDIARHRSGAGDRHIELLLPAGTIAFEADPRRIQQAFVNLIGNAIKYTADDGDIWVIGTQVGSKVMVRVKDTGVGIEPEMLERIFEMFAQAPTPMVRDGLGIGLALVKQIVELHGGSVSANSEGTGKGSEFTVRLPLRQADRRHPVHIA